MAAGLAPPTLFIRGTMALMVAFAIAFVLPASSTLANSNTTVVSDDEEGGKKKDRSDKKSDDRDRKSDKDGDDSDDDDSDDDDVDDDSSSRKGKKSDDDDDDSDSDDDDSESDDDDRDSDDEDSGDAPSIVASGDAQAVERSAKPEPATTATPAPAATAGSLLATGVYLTMPDAIAHARKAGAQGDVLQVDLEFDAFRGFATCDVTFSSGTEYEMNAETGELLGEKQKDPNKLALLTPLATDAKSLKAFTDIIGQVSKATGQAVIEMELKHPKGKAGVIFEVVTADGMTSHFDAATGQPAAGI